MGDMEVGSSSARPQGIHIEQRVHSRDVVKRHRPIPLPLLFVKCKFAFKSLEPLMRSAIANKMSKKLGILCE
ncbi:hypothetical protein BHE74_00031352 [Ensete ventricosum]|nr:hypothetical protein BHE74_00031352 [Ensete ventricosum]